MTSISGIGAYLPTILTVVVCNVIIFIFCKYCERKEKHLHREYKQSFVK